MLIKLAGGKSIELVRGDLTLEEVDAIVNAANGELLPGGGVCGAIHDAGGSAVTRECEEYVDQHGPVRTGHAAATTAGNMPARHVIHAVGPVWEGGQEGEPAALASCYRRSIELADEMGLTSIAFPSISTGVYGYPVDQAAPVALSATREALLVAQHVQLARFVLFNGAIKRAYEAAAAGWTDG